MVRMKAADDLHSGVAVRVLACPGCARELRSEIGVTPVSLCCPACGADFWVRCSGLVDDGWVQIRMQGSQDAELYQVLGLTAGAGEAAVKAAYRRQALRWHPDRNGNSERSVSRFRAIAAAYAVLSDPQQRAAYDAGLDSRSGDWRRWAAVRERPVVTGPGSPQEPRHRRGPWGLMVWRCLAIGLVAGVVAGLLLPRGTRLLQPVLGGVALVGLLRLARHIRRPADPQTSRAIDER